MNILGFDARLSSPNRLLTIEDYRAAARRKLPDFAWAYVDGGADELVTVRDNRNAYSAWSLRDKILMGVETPDLCTTAAGFDLSMPVILAPTGYSALCNWQGDLCAARAVKATGTRLVASTVASYSIEEITEAGGQEIAFQLYPRATEVAVDLMNRAWQAGVRTLFVTVDVPVPGFREAEARNGMTIPPILSPATMINLAMHPRWSLNALRHKRISAGNLRPRTPVHGQKKSVSDMMSALGEESRQFRQQILTWDDVAWIRENWKGRMILKGILDASDAERAVSIGADGIVVSNHGGRQLDYARASIAALPEIVATVAGRAEILLDGGIRRGSDIVKALALGATAVLIGRPWLYGAAVSGQAGIEAVLGILRRDMQTTMTLMGAASLDDLNKDSVIPRVQLPQERGDETIMHDRTIRPRARF